MLLAVALGVVLTGAPYNAMISTFQPQSSGQARGEGRRGVVSQQEVSALIQWARRSKAHIVDKWEKAVEVFPKGWTVDGYPSSVGDPTSNQSAVALFILTPQLQRDGIKVDEVETVLLFSGDDGRVTRDVVLVLSKRDKRIVGVYQAWHGHG